MGRTNTKQSVAEQLDEVLARIPALRAAGVTSVSVDGLSLELGTAAAPIVAAAPVAPVSPPPRVAMPSADGGPLHQLARLMAAVGETYQLARLMAAVGETYVHVNWDKAIDAIIAEGGYVFQSGFSLRADLEVPVLGGTTTISASGPRAEGPLQRWAESIYYPTPKTEAPKVELPAELAPAATPATSTLIVAIVDTTPAPAEKSDEPGDSTSARFAQIEIN